MDNPPLSPTSQKIQHYEVADGSYNFGSEFQKIVITALTGNFSVNTGAGDVTYPITTASGEKIDIYESEAGILRTMSEVRITVPPGSTALFWTRQV